MNARANKHCRGGRAGVAGSILIIVLWISFGLVSLALYFGHSMLFEFRASDQNAAGMQAELAIEGAARYITFVLTNMTNYSMVGQMPSTNAYEFAGVPVGEAAFWVIGRGDPLLVHRVPVYGLVDEASKLNLNTATYDMLMQLPNMSNYLAAAIIDWRDADSDINTNGGAESETYQLRMPPYLCKNAPFESTEELRLVAGGDLNLLYGEDANLNGVLDPNENDGLRSPPYDNGDGKLDPGILEYVTVWSREPNTQPDGTPRVNVNASGNNTNLTALLTQLYGQTRANEIYGRVRGRTNFTSTLAFYLASGMTQQEFDQAASALTVTSSNYVDGLVNINTASAAVLNCLPGIGPYSGQDVVNYRQYKTTNELWSVAWLTQVLDATNAVRAGRYITAYSYQFSADVVAVGNHGRGYRRTWFVFDTSEGAPKVLYRRDRSRLGWALGEETRQPWLAAAKGIRR